jgi:sporulation protein YlmC with PRC-barrel domain
MRASDLLGARVVTAGGEQLGFVRGLVCSLDGPTDGPLPAPRLRGLRVSPRGAGASLGYQQPDMRGPWLVAALVRRRHRTAREVPWEMVREVADGVVRLRA